MKPPYSCLVLQAFEKIGSCGYLFEHNHHSILGNQPAFIRFDYKSVQQPFRFRHLQRQNRLRPDKRRSTNRPQNHRQQRSRLYRATKLARRAASIARQIARLLWSNQRLLHPHRHPSRTKPNRHQRYQSQHHQILFCPETQTYQNRQARRKAHRSILPSRKPQSMAARTQNQSSIEKPMPQSRANQPTAYHGKEPRPCSRWI